MPASIIYRPKAAFGAPIRSWISNDLRVMVDDLLSEENVSRRGLLNYSFVHRLIEDGRSGAQDNAWAATDQWRSYSQAMSNAAMIAMDAARNKDKALLSSAGDALIATCLSCHNQFKPESPTEGILHQPDYDHLYHLFE